MYKLNCIVLGDDPGRIFEIKIAPTESVSALQKVIKEENKQQFDRVDAKSLKLWKVDLPVDDALKRTLESLELNKMESPSPVDEMLEVFDNAPPRKRLHIVIQGPHAVPSESLHLNCVVFGDESIFAVEIAQTQTVDDLKDLIKDRAKPQFDHVPAQQLELWKVNINLDNLHLLNAIGDVGVELKALTQLSKVFTDGVERGCIHVVIQHIPVIVGRRLAYLEEGAGTPSIDGKPLPFAKKQEEQVGYLCNRPRTAADPVPVTLLEPIFADFVDDCQNHQPTVVDNDFIRELSEKMSSFHTDELARMNTFRQVLRDYGISLNASMVDSTKCTTDGHLLSANGKFVQVMVKGQNEIGSGGAEPFLEAMLYYRKFMENLKDEVAGLRSFIPCIHIMVFGACIGFAGSVFIEKTSKLTNLYSVPLPTIETEIRSLGYPYPRSYTTSSGQIQEFLYDETRMLRDRLIFFGETVGDAARSQICIKFVRHYSPEAHEFCASKGHAPNLIAYNNLPGGWNMVIMDALDIDNGPLRQPGSYRLLSQMPVLDRQPLEEVITSLIQDLHSYNDGYVHGDLWDANFVARDDKHFMLLDFDWAGPIGKARYPMYVNRNDIRRPDGARDGEKIVAKHDLDMLKYIFHTEEDGWETAAKHRRIW
ncbi:hypothetical protein BDR05DRAFT_1063613 [Suillus weaverae]|nr:hypothetical protein BDR05DRAFT_1063613 [Suillus weaverae]